jgi:hypothetical protein
MLLNVSVVLYRTRHTHKLQLLDTCNQRQKICAASTRLPTAILAVRITLGLEEILGRYQTRLVALDTQVSGFQDATLNCGDMTGGFALMATLAEHIAVCGQSYS